MPEEGAPPLQRSVVVFEADSINRFATERLLKRENFWTFATHDAQTVVRVVTVEAVDVVLVDLGLGALDAVPLWQRRRRDASSPAGQPPLPEGYAVLRPLHADPSCARYPVVTLRAGAGGSEPLLSCRFAVVDYLPRPRSAKELVFGLDAVWRDFVHASSAPLPDAPEEETPALLPPAAPSPRPFASTPLPLRSALVVDPDPFARHAVTAALRKHGFTVHEADGGDEGFGLALARQPWLILTELDLPDADGVEFCRRIRSNSLLRRTPVVFLSRRDDCDSRYQAFDAGGDDYLTKPAPEREMLIRLELLLRRFGEVESLGPAGRGVQGSLDVVGAPAVLQLCNLNQLTGVLTATRGGQSIRIAFRRGAIVSACGPDHGGPDAIYAFVTWHRGEFAFDAGAVVEGPEFEADFDALLLEGCRRLDETRRGGTRELPAAI
jgi:DNA-binding response OmpR family regulator